MAGISIAQAAVEYLLIAGRGVIRFLEHAATAAVALIGTPRGILIAAALVFLLIASLSRRHRR